MRTLVLVASALLVFPACRASPERPDQAVVAGSKKLLAHYMPWYESKPVSGRWGWHWTMEHFDPDRFDEGERRQIASHYYPLIGAYDSSDPDVLEYHSLLLKLAGIDGVIIDWYGIEDFRDYAMLHANTERIIDHVGKAGLEFAICYEDQTINHMVHGGRLSRFRRVAHARQVLQHLERTWFADPAYLCYSHRPVLLVFGPQGLSDRAWERALRVLNREALFLTLDRPRGAASGAFAWPQMPGGTLTPDDFDKYVARFHEESRDWVIAISVATPGFHDIYQEAGVRESYGYLSDEGGETFRRSLESALASDAAAVQLVTWNDFGEGTNIEPTVESGYRYLEMVQTARRQHIEPSFPYRADDLRLPLQLFELRKQGRQALANLLSSSLLADKMEQARAIGRGLQIDERTPG